ncbi:MAG: AMP-binding protein [Hyphomicrobiaceae bacterium]|nr:AMP-binding protein [Hyphomicrobiaceae bacterium]
MTEFAWLPDPKLDAAANATAFMHALGASDFSDMVHCADYEPERFHSKLFEFIDYRFYRPYTRILDESRGIAWARWCPGATTNVVLNAVDRWRGTPTYDKAAIVWEGESGTRRSLTYRDLDREICRLSGGLRALGLAKGDVVAIYMPNLPEAAIAMLAVAKIGGVVMPLFSGFGAEAIATRLETSGARALITVDGSSRRGKLVDSKAVVDDAVSRSRPIEHVVVLRHSGNDIDWNRARDHWWDEVCRGQPGEAPTEEMDPEAPFLLVFTSGTTDKPKGVVHTHIGFPVKSVIDLWLVLDCKPEDRVMWISDMGWVVGPLLIYGVTVIGATLVLVEGAPNYPDPDRMWRLAAENGVTYLGVAPTTIRTFMAQDSKPLETHDLSSLRLMISSGEAWTEAAWWWLFDKVGRSRLPILNLSGGTEMVGIIGSTVKLPLKPCALNCAVPGTGADVVNEDGTTAPAGSVGELVQRRPSIGLTRGLWQDSERYLKTYWSTWPDIWHHGDFVSRDKDGQWYVHGRSDDTMKIAGKRTGPAEIESQLLATGRLSEAAAVGIPDPIKGSAIVIVCVPKPGIATSEELRNELSEAVARSLGAPFRPKQVIFISDLPKTRNMKIMRRVIRAVCSGDNPGDLSSLVNPEAVEELRQRCRERR